jgi:general secretion pathway protein H
MSARGSERARPAAAARRRPPRYRAGFTLIELLIVLAIVARATALVTLAIRDPQAARLDQEAERLAALLESARAESRVSGVPVVWVPARPVDTPPEAGSAADFRFVGLAGAVTMPSRWLDRDTQADLLGARALQLGPEPFIGPQRVLLRLGDRRLELATDGLGPFTVAAPAAQARP